VTPAPICSASALAGSSAFLGTSEAVQDAGL
jgi:hypothetical protein